MTQPTAAQGKLIDKSNNPQIQDRQSSVAAVSGTPDGTYSANEQTMLSDLQTAVNAIIERLEAHGLIADN